ncbi:MAG: hypothetical protein ACXVP8_06000 [Actinomycetota bacterium]
MAMQSTEARSRVTPARARSIGWGLLAVVGIGVGATLLFWHGETLQLHPLGADFTWPVIIGAGVMAMSRGIAPGRSVAALIIGSGVGVIVSYEGLNYLPATALGTGMAVGMGAALVTLVSLMSRGRVPFGPAVIALGLGVGAAQIVPAGPTTTPTDVLAIWTAVAFALGIGVAGSLLVEAIIPRARGEQGSEPGSEALAEAPVVDLRERKIDVAGHERGSEIGSPTESTTDQIKGGRDS